ncbi:MAG TPA: signal peptidase II [Victivallales bacterium]|nr:signal peptidase II [Victivallales bacterium]
MNDVGKAKKHSRQILWIGLIFFIILVIADQITKYYIVLNSFRLTREPVNVIPGFFNIVSVRNTGAAWGMFNGNNIILLTVAVVAFILIIIFFKAITEGFGERTIALFMIMSGIVGNSIDRIYRGSVVDFLDFHLHGWHWPSFNIADSAICVGVAVMIISSLLRVKKKK